MGLRVLLLLLLATSGLLAGCSRTVEPGPTRLKDIAYHRTGGLMGAHDRIDIAPDGAIAVTSWWLGTGVGKMTDEQVGDLTRAFAGWETLANTYPAPPRVAGRFVIEIRHGEKTVAVSDAARNVPFLFTHARERMESLARTITGTKKR